MSIGRLQTREIGLGIVLLLGILMFATTGSTRTNGTLSHEIIQWFGIFAIVLCIFGRTWTSLYIGGRKNRALLTKGPYSVVRNPLYVFSILGAAGAGAQLGSMLSTIIFGLLVWAVFYIEALWEERDMAARHGAKYGAYRTSVPRFLPNPFLWRDEPILKVRPKKVLLTFADSALLLLFPPLADGFALLQKIGILPVIFRLP
jgi:protein-S-isoprenylcysteine O-methyltransferase Ste14